MFSVIAVELSFSVIVTSVSGVHVEDVIRVGTDICFFQLQLFKFFFINLNIFSSPPQILTKTLLLDQVQTDPYANYIILGIIKRLLMQKKQLFEQLKVIIL